MHQTCCLQGPVAARLLERLKSRITDVLNQPHLNLDYLQYIVNQETFIVTAASSTGGENKDHNMIQYD